MDIPFMRDIKVDEKEFHLNEKVEMVYEKRITSFGNSAKIDAPKKYRGWRAYVIIVKDWSIYFVPHPVDKIHNYHKWYNHVVSTHTVGSLGDLPKPL